MIITYILALLAVIAGTLWFFNYLLTHPEDLVLRWGEYTYEMTTAKAIAILLVTFITLYLFVRLITHLINTGSYLRKRKQLRLQRKSSQLLINGLIDLVEGDWEQAETTLTEDINNSPVPLLNYLAAARAADLLDSNTRRDNYLKCACDNTKGARTAVAISQAEMQLSSGQLEQARAGLITLLEEHPKHRYAKRLLAKSYYQQEDWKNLSSLLQASSKQQILKESEVEQFEDAALKGVFQMYANEDDLHKLKAEWKKLPSALKAKPYAILRYSKALIAAGDGPDAVKLISNTLNKHAWDNSLVEVYGTCEHKNLNHAITEAEKWLAEHDSNPNLLLALARLHGRNKLWGKARSLYESSLNLAPNSQGYLELAQLLEDTNDHENSQTCYRQGLIYSITGKGEALILKSKKEHIKEGYIIEEDIPVV
ncbi:MAG: Heme biosynthesis protein HemY [uncultured Thiotrichaceae bacterium]|uniref:Heme biosynthesis protein HemY n=1 Tax=uncultured Thiotrichaceae bacterium TaxID=298394 RepID=A0A6S6UCI6_9GAMM|nr:MAG: Heme biosynthesis protein HemY [uncultured Thiotrichaceae bacterium]